MKGIFIVLDGPDATGTSTHAALLARRLEAAGQLVLLTAEPTGGPVGRRIREFLKMRPSTGAVTDPLELQMLFTEDRAWHVKNVIEPALAEGKTVICDRYSPSTIIYAEAQGLDSMELKELNNKFLRPTCTIFTLPPVEIALTRLAKRASKEVFERDDFQRKIHAGYTAFATADPSIHVIDTSGAKEETSEKIWGIVRAFL